MASLPQQAALFLTQLEAVQRPSFPPLPIKLIVGVSGGPDSLALLHVLKSLYPLDKLAVVHLNHSLRPEADADAHFVSQTAAAWGISYYQEQVDVADLARQKHLSLEAAGRAARYACFARFAAQLQASGVVVGHHADDQAETVLLHLLRGSGLAGLRGMRPVSLVPGTADVWLLRPFLAVSRADIEAYCEQHGLTPRIDASNQDVTYERNRVRHDLLPLLATYNPQIKARLQDLATTVTADYALLAQLQQEAWTAVCQEQGEGWLVVDRAAWRALPLALRRRTLRLAVRQLRPSQQEISLRAIEQARHCLEAGSGSDQAALPGELTLTLAYDRAFITTDGAAAPIDQPQLVDEAPLPLPIPGQVSLAHGWTLKGTAVDTPSLPHIQANQDRWTAYLAIEPGQPLWLRPRQPGERFQPLGSQGHSAKLKAVMINRKIPAHLRSRWPIVASAHQALWLVGHHLDERARVTAVSQNIIKLECYK